MQNKIFLVRHAQSEANVNFRVLRTITNMSANITETGINQAHQTGVFLSKKLSKDLPLKIWNSPYNRTRQTAKIIKEELKKNGFIFEEFESIYLSERQFGVLDNVEHFTTEFHQEAKHYLMHKKQKHDFFVRPPLGESPFDMCLRLDAFINFELNTENVQHVMVSHGAAIKGFLMMFLKKDYDWYNEQKNPLNASVHMIEEIVKEKNYLGEIFSPNEKTT